VQFVRSPISENGADAVGAAGRTGEAIKGFRYRLVEREPFVDVGVDIIRDYLNRQTGVLENRAIPSLPCFLF
jgi:hypothetical protein